MTIPARPSFHPTYAKLLHALLLGQGLDANGALAQVGLTPERLRDNEQAVDAAQIRELILLAVKMTKCPWIGLEFGLMAQVFMHGQVGYAAVASATLGQAVEVLARFVGLRSTAFRLELRAGHDASELVVVELADMGEARVVMLEAVLTIVARLLQTLSGRTCAEVEYGLPWAEPAWSQRYREDIGGIRRFDAQGLSIRLPAALLASPCMTGDPDAYAAAWEDCERKLARAPAGNSAREWVRARLMRCEANYPTLDAVATEQARSARTLMRQLKAEGCCYQDILDEVRYERARWYLLNTQASMETIAEQLGLQDTSNFSRSFRRWSGVRPSEFKSTGKVAKP
jgi:AraC-like DNA-binding protein